jgi:uncharacterized protein
VLKLEWDRKKAAANTRKHGVSFEEAATCFDDPRACYLHKEAPSYEDRLILIGVSSKRRLLFVVHAEVGRDTRVRATPPSTDRCRAILSYLYPAKHFGQLAVPPRLARALAK